MGSHRICEFLSLGRGVVPTVFWGKRNCQGQEGGFLRNTSTALILNRFSPRLIRLRRRLVRTMSDTEPTKTGARMNLSHLGRVREERRKIKGRDVPLDSSLLMGDPPSHEGLQGQQTPSGDRPKQPAPLSSPCRVYWCCPRPILNSNRTSPASSFRTSLSVLRTDWPVNASVTMMPSGNSTPSDESCLDESMRVSLAWSRLNTLK